VQVDEGRIVSGADLLLESGLMCENRSGVLVYGEKCGLGGGFPDGAGEAPSLEQAG
jgi:hypothetical protein